jgi:energy-coupling factor transporter ATP-binding protein EcfA2
MGNRCSQQEEAAQCSAWIDRQIEEDGKKLKKECKVLLLSTSGSGKSTIVEQMRLVHQGGPCYDTKMSFREDIYYNLLHSAQAVATAMHKFKVEPADPSNVVNFSSDLASIVSLFNVTPCSQRWIKCWNTTSMRSGVHPPLSSLFGLPGLYTVSGRTNQCQSL